MGFLTHTTHLVLAILVYCGTMVANLLGAPMGNTFLNCSCDILMEIVIGTFTCLWGINIDLTMPKTVLNILAALLEYPELEPFQKAIYLLTSNRLNVGHTACVTHSHRIGIWNQKGKRGIF